MKRQRTIFRAHRYAKTLNFDYWPIRIPNATPRLRGLQELIMRMEYGSHDARTSEERRVRLLVLLSISRNNNGGIYT